MNICKNKCKCKTCLIIHNICWAETKFSNHIQQSKHFYSFVLQFYSRYILIMKNNV